MSKPELLTFPGAVDLHVHFREPSSNKAETIESGSRAALIGGVTLACDMPNNPGNPTWTDERLKDKLHRISRSSYIPMAAYAGSQPESDNIGELRAMAGRAIGSKAYGAPTTGNERDYEAEDFREIFEEWHRVAPDKPIMLHSGKNNLDDFIGLVAQELGHHLHVCHVNNSADVMSVARAKAHELPVTCGVCPHHLFKTSHDVKTQGAFAQMQPPLVSQVDSEKLFYHLAQGNIDILETDHAPHSAASKLAAEHGEGTCYGVPGIEFAMPLLFYQMRKDRISAERLAEATSSKPAKIIGVTVSPATTVEWSMDEYRIEDEGIQVESGAGWTPYLGMLAVGRPKNVMVGGKHLIKNGEVVGRSPQVVNRGSEV